jgi:shikimate dehydrogenase
MISGKTSCYAILGDPIEQALSPIVHNAAFQALGMDAVMLGCRVTPDQLENAMAGVRAMHFAGLAVTMPLKTAIVPLLDACEDKISFLGAVNVVACRDGRYIGYNTDGDGFVKNMQVHGADPAGKRVFLFGAGGAARGIACALLENGIRRLIVCNIEEKMAQDMIRPLREQFPRTEIAFLPLGDPQTADLCRQSDVILNATSMGMNDSPSPHAALVPWEDLPADTVFGDTIHKPIDTAFIRTARAHGFCALTGDGMMLQQAVLAFRLLTGHEAPAAVMEKAIHLRMESEKQ